MAKRFAYGCWCACRERKKEAVSQAKAARKAEAESAAEGKEEGGAQGEEGMRRLMEKAKLEELRAAKRAEAQRRKQQRRRGGQPADGSPPPEERERTRRKAHAEVPKAAELSQHLHEAAAAAEVAAEQAEKAEQPAAFFGVTPTLEPRADSGSGGKSSPTGAGYYVDMDASPLPSSPSPDAAAAGGGGQKRVVGVTAAEDTETAEKEQSMLAARADYFFGQARKLHEEFDRIEARSGRRSLSYFEASTLAAELGAWSAALVTDERGH